MARLLAITVFPRHASAVSENHGSLGTAVTKNQKKGSMDFSEHRLQDRVPGGIAKLRFMVEVNRNTCGGTAHQQKNISCATVSFVPP